MANEAKTKGEVMFFGTKKEWFVCKRPCPPSGGEYWGEKNVIAKDEKGYYLTHSNYVGVHILDPNRMYDRTEVLESVVNDILAPQKADAQAEAMAAPIPA